MERRFTVFRCFQLSKSNLWVSSCSRTYPHNGFVALMCVLPFRASDQNQKGKKSLEVKKNRFDGDLGEVHLVFDPHSSRLREMG